MTSQTYPEDLEFSRRAHENQTRLTSELKPQYDVIVCGAGASGSVVARRLAENADMHVLLIEAGGSDDIEAVLDPDRWPANLGSERDWSFQAQPNPHLNDRALPMSMGRGGERLILSIGAAPGRFGFSLRPIRVRWYTPCLTRPMSLGARHSIIRTAV